MTAPAPIAPRSRLRRTVVHKDGRRERARIVDAMAGAFGRDWSYILTLRLPLDVTRKPSAAFHNALVEVRAGEAIPEPLYLYEPNPYRSRR